MPPHRGGVERVAQQLAQRYVRAGHEVRWLATAAGATDRTDREGGIERERVPALNALEQRFGMPFPIPFPGGLRRIADAARVADVVHLHDCLYLPIVAADRAAWRARVPTLVTQHVGMVSFGGAVDPLLFAAYRSVGRSVLRHAAKVVFVNEGVRTWFHEHIDPRLESEHLPNAVDLELFHPASAASRAAGRAAFGIAADVPVVLFAGRLVAKKNLGLVVAALRLLAGPWHLLVVGDGPARSTLLGLGDRCTHVSDLAHARMPEAYAAADLFALPSRDEGTPLTVLEAMASGLLVVTSDDRAFAEFAPCPGVLQVAPAPDALAHSLGPLLEDAGRRAVAGAATRAWAEAHYGEDRIAARYLALIAELTATRRRAPRALRG